MPTCKHAGIPTSTGLAGGQARVYSDGITTVTVSNARRRLGALARLIEAGETVIVTSNGQRIFDILPHSTRGGINREAIEELKRRHGVERLVTYIADDFDEPLPEDFFLQPLPEKP